MEIRNRDYEKWRRELEVQYIVALISRNSKRDTELEKIPEGDADLHQNALRKTILRSLPYYWVISIKCYSWCFYISLSLPVCFSRSVKKRWTFIVYYCKMCICCEHNSNPSTYWTKKLKEKKNVQHCGKWYFLVEEPMIFMPDDNLLNRVSLT